MRALIAGAILILNTSIIDADSLRVAQSPLDFYAEEITLSVNDTAAAVTGIYFFRNNSAREGPLTVVFPFYVDSLCGYPFMVEGHTVENVGSGVPLNIRLSETANSAIIEIPLSANAVTVWCLEYSQRILGNSARYILTSTQTWGKPLEEATYEFVAPSYFENLRVWPEADTVINDNGHVRYKSFCRDFMPSRDMEMSWTPKPN